MTEAAAATELKTSPSDAGANPPADAGAAAADVGATLLNSGTAAGEAGGDTGGAGTAADADAWRALMAGEDQDAMKELLRFKTKQDFIKAFLEQKKALSRRAEAPKLPDNATPQQIAEYRKLMGVPEKAEDYGIAAPEGYQISDVEKAMLSDFAKVMHSKNVPAAMVKEAADFFFKAQAANLQQLNVLDSERQAEWQGELRQKLGKDFDNLISAGEAFLNQKFADNAEAKSALLNARLPGGGRLGDYPAFIEMVVDLALNNGFTDRIEASDLEVAGGKSLAEQQKDLESLYTKDRARYDLPETQAKLNKIIELRLSRGEIDEIGNEIKRRRSV